MRSKIRFMTIAFFLFTLTFNALAETPATLALNPTTLRKQLLETNLSITEQLNQVEQANKAVSEAKANLLPGVQASVGGPTFLISGVNLLLPFFAPSNWFNYKAEKKNFEADKVAFLVMELNLYSSALSLYYTAYANFKAEQALAEEVKDLTKYQSIFAKENHYGVIAGDILLTIQNWVSDAEDSRLQTERDRDQEVAQLKELLALSPESTITFDDSDLPPSSWEDKSTTAILDYAYNKAPEKQQIDLWASEAGLRTKAARFSFLGTGSLSSISQGTNESLPSSFNLGAGLQFGFGYFPAVGLAKLKQDQTALLYTKLHQDTQQIVESTMPGLKASKAEYANAALEEQNNQEQYKRREMQQRYGVAALVDVIYVRTLITPKTLQKIQGELNVNLERVVLERTLIENEFSQIQGCRTQNPSKETKHMSLDELCRQLD